MRIVPSPQGEMGTIYGLDGSLFSAKWVIRRASGLEAWSRSAPWPGGQGGLLVAETASAGRVQKWATVLLISLGSTRVLPVRHG